MEYFDVLTENGEYTDRIETRENCHKYGLWHKAVALFIINSDGQVLLQKRSSKKKMWPNLWDISAGGHVLSGEFGFQAIIREIEEELGLKVSRENIIFMGCATSINEKGDIINKHFNEYYIVNKNVNFSELKLQTEEVSDVKWFNKEEILNKIENNYEDITDKIGCWDYLKRYYEWKEKNNI